MGFLSRFECWRLAMFPLLLAVLALGPACAAKGGSSGDIVPENEPVQQGGATVSGVVSGPDGTPLPGVTVVAIESDSGRTAGTTHSDSQGRFQLALSPGRYRIKAELQGFSQKVMDVTVQPAQTSSLSLVMGDVVPVGEPQPAPSVKPPLDQVPAPNTGAEVTKLTFENDTALHAWLNETAAAAKTVFTIIPLEDRISLFCTKPGASAAYTVLTADGSINESTIQSYLALNRDKTLVGVHRLVGKFLIILRNGA